MWWFYYDYCEKKTKFASSQKTSTVEFYGEEEKNRTYACGARIIHIYTVSVRVRRRWEEEDLKNMWLEQFFLYFETQHSVKK